MATASVGTPTLRQFDIYMPFEFIEKCVQLSCVGRGICWSGAVRDVTGTAGQLHQDHNNLRIENTGCEQWRLDSPSENVQIAHVQTCISPENMLIISFSKVQLQVHEGRCGFWLSNVQKDESACAVSAYPAVVSGEVGSTVLDGLTTSKPTSPSAVTTPVDYVETENNTKTSGDLARSSQNLDSHSVDSNIIGGCYSTSTGSVSSDALSKGKNTAGSMVEKQPCLPGIHSSQPCLPGIHSSQPCLPGMHSSQPCLPGMHSSQPCLPGIHSSQPCLPGIHSSQPCLPGIHSSQPCLPGRHSSQLTSVKSFSLCDSIASPLKTNLDENLLDDKQVKKLYFQSEINSVHRLQELIPSTLVLCQETDSNDLSGEKSKDNDKLLQSPTISLTQESEIKAIKKTYGRKPKKQCAQQDKNLCPQVTEEMTKVNDNLVIPKKKYMLRGVRVPKCLIEQEKNDRQLVPKNSCKNQKIESAKGSCQDIENCLSDKEFHLNNDKPTLLSTSENPVSPPLLLLSMSKKQQADLDSVDNSRPKRRKRNNTRVVQCRYCKKMFCDYTGVDEHVKKFHSNEADFVDYIAELKKLKVVICDKCNVTLQNRYLLQEHEDRVHSTADSEVCSVCGKKYKNLKSLRNHVRFVHYTNGKAHLCHLCPAKFKWAGTLKQHIQEVHEGMREFSCPTCSKEFFRKSQLNRHIRIHGSDASKRITCTLCNKGFWFENNYLRHMKAIHQPQLEEFHCSYCGKGFSQKASMVAHVQLVHLKIYTYSCKICKMGFTRSKLLQVHMVQVHNETDFEVKDGRQSRFKYSRTAADLLYCHYCNQGFYYKAQVVEHIHQEHTFPYRCDRCKQGFVLKKFLDNHLKKAHGVEVEVTTNDEDESNDAEEVMENLLELKSESAVLPKCIADSMTTLENSEGIPGESLLTPPDTECYEDLLGAPGTDTYEVSTSATSLLLEVAKDGGTVHYYIQHGNRNDKGNQVDNNQQVIEDIASLLLVAEEASSKESLPMISGQAQAELVNEIQSKNAVVHFIPTNAEAVNSSVVEDDT